MHGTCVETPPQQAEGEDEPVMFSFFSDIAHNSTVIELVQNISKILQNTLGSLNKFLSRWKRYRVLWKLDKVSWSTVKMCINFLDLGNSNRMTKPKSRV